MGAIEFHEILQPSDHREFTLAAQMVFAVIRPKVMRRAEFNHPYRKVLVPCVVLVGVLLFGILYADLSPFMRGLLIVLGCVGILLGVLYVFMIRDLLKKGRVKYEAAMREYPGGNNAHIDEMAITTSAVDGPNVVSIPWDNAKMLAVTPNLYIFIEGSSDMAIFFNKVNLTPEQLETLEALIATHMKGAIIRTK